MEFTLVATPLEPVPTVIVRNEFGTTLIFDFHERPPPPPPDVGVPPAPAPTHTPLMLKIPYGTFHVYVPGDVNATFPGGDLAENSASFDIVPSAGISHPNKIVHMSFLGSPRSVDEAWRTMYAIATYCADSPTALQVVLDEFATVMRGLGSDSPFATWDATPTLQQIFDHIPRDPAVTTYSPYIQPTDYAMVGCDDVADELERLAVQMLGVAKRLRDGHQQQHPTSSQDALFPSIGSSTNE